MCLRLVLSIDPAQQKRDADQGSEADCETAEYPLVPGFLEESQQGIECVECQEKAQENHCGDESTGQSAEDYLWDGLPGGGESPDQPDESSQQEEDAESEGGKCVQGGCSGIAQESLSEPKECDSQSQQHNCIVEISGEGCGDPSGSE